MIDNENFEKIKLALRIKNNALDDDIKKNIDAALLEMSRVGIDIETIDSLILMCVELFCKHVYNFENKGDKYLENFEKLRNSLSLSSKYRGATDE